MKGEISFRKENTDTIMTLQLLVYLSYFSLGFSDLAFLFKLARDVIGWNLFIVKDNLAIVVGCFNSPG